MDTRLKNILGIAVIITVIALAYAAVVYSTYYSKSIQPSSFRSFSATGEGSEYAIPDVAQFTFDIITEGGKDLTNLQKENTNKSNKAIEFLKSKSIEAKDIATQNYNVNPRYQTSRCNSGPFEIQIQGAKSASPTVCPPPEIVGYTITQTTSVKVRDFSKTGEILSGIVQNGANSVSQLNFTIDDPSSVQDKARAQAIEKAKAKAESIAEAGGFSVGRLLSIEEGYYPLYNVYSMEKSTLGMGGVADATISAPTIEPGSQKITVNITLRYEIK